MKPLSSALCALVVLLAGASSADAQTCVGAPSFAQAPFQVGVSAAFRDGGQGAGGRFAAGSESLFAGAGVFVLDVSDFDATRTNISAFAGTDLGVDGDRRVFVCPLGFVTFGSGPDIGPVDVSTIGFQGGGSVGVVASTTDTLMVIPTFGLMAAWERVTLESGGVEADESDSFGIANLGVGFVFNERVGIAPGISVPFSVGDSDVVFSIAFTFNFGR